MSQNNNITGSKKEQITAEQNILHKLGEVAEIDHPPAYLDSSPQTLSIWTRLRLFLQNLFASQHNSNKNQMVIASSSVGFSSLEAILSNNINLSINYLNGLRFP